MRVIIFKLTFLFFLFKVWGQPSANDESITSIINSRKVWATIDKSNHDQIATDVQPISRKESNLLNFPKDQVVKIKSYGKDWVGLIARDPINGFNISESLKRTLGLQNSNTKFLEIKFKLRDRETLEVLGTQFDHLVRVKHDFYDPSHILLAHLGHCYSPSSNSAFYRLFLSIQLKLTVKKIQTISERSRNEYNLPILTLQDVYSESDRLKYAYLISQVTGDPKIKSIVITAEPQILDKFLENPESIFQPIPEIPLIILDNDYEFRNGSPVQSESSLLHLCCIRSIRNDYSILQEKFGWSDEILKEKLFSESSLLDHLEKLIEYEEYMIKLLGHEEYRKISSEHFHGNLNVEHYYRIYETMNKKGFLKEIIKNIMKK